MRKILILLVLTAPCCMAIDSERAVQAIIGEAAGQSLSEKVAIASAIRNRGTLDGIRGLHNQGMIQSQPAWVWRDARTAWARSATNDVAHGGTFWESNNFNRPAWSVGMTQTAKVGCFTFWKK